MLRPDAAAPVVAVREPFRGPVRHAEREHPIRPSATVQPGAGHPHDDPVLPPARNRLDRVRGPGQRKWFSGDTDGAYRASAEARQWAIWSAVASIVARGAVRGLCVVGRPRIVKRAAGRSVAAPDPGAAAAAGDRGGSRGGAASRWPCATRGSRGTTPSCPLYAVSGLYCPGCGTLRCLHALTHGDLGAALGFNVLTVLAPPAWCSPGRPGCGAAVPACRAGRLPRPGCSGRCCASSSASGCCATCRRSAPSRLSPPGAGHRADAAQTPTGPFGYFPRAAPSPNVRTGRTPTSPWRGNGREGHRRRPGHLAVATGTPERTTQVVTSTVTGVSGDLVDAVRDAAVTGAAGAIVAEAHDRVKGEDEAEPGAEEAPSA